MNRDHFYEYIRYADLNTIRTLCSTNKYYNNLCNTEPFQKILKQKYQDLLDRIDKIATHWQREILSNPNKSYFFQLNPEHRITINESNINEEVLSYQHSLLFKLFDQETDFSNLSTQDIMNYISNIYTQSCYQVSNYELITQVISHGTIAILPYWENAQNRGYHFGDEEFSAKLQRPNSVQIHSLLKMIFLRSQPQITFSL